MGQRTTPNQCGNPHRSGQHIPYGLDMTNCPATPPPRLSPELVALVSSVELSQSDWWRRAVGQAVLSLLWSETSPLSVSELVRGLDREHAIKVTATEVREQLAQLELAAAVVGQGADAFKISEEHAVRMLAYIDRHENEEHTAKREFLELAVSLLPDFDPEQAWTAFTEILLVPLIYNLGAHTYDFLRGAPFVLNESPLLRNYLSHFEEAERDAAQDLAAAFLDPTRQSARAYVVNRLTTYFFIQATSLPRTTLEALAQSTKKRMSFTAFVDTNLLFSVLDLHENPANEAAAALEGLMGELKGVVDFQLYVTNETLQEARASLSGAAAGMENIVLTARMITAASSMSLSGLRKRFVEQARRVDGVRSSEAYFGYYADNLLALARAHGIELFNEDLSPYHTKQEVIDDLLVEIEVQRKRRALQGRPEKAYNQIRHDVVLWHWVRDKRDVYVDSPLAARYWIVTLDYALIGFDEHKSKIYNSLIPICLHPATLVQMLAFWVPRGEVLDSAIVRTLRIPLLFFEYDSELERATVKILQTLSRFANIENLSAESITALVANDALRSRMLSARADEEMVSLIESELIEQEEELRRQLTEKEERVVELERTRLARDQEVERLGGKILDLDEVANVSHREAEAATKGLIYAETRATLAESRAVRARLLLFGVFALMVSAIPAGGAGWLASQHFSSSRRSAIIVFTTLGWLGIGCLAWLGLVRWLGSRSERDAASGSRNWIRSYFTLVVLGFIINAASAFAFG